MLSFNELQEKKSKIKINPKKEDVMEGSCGSYSKGGEVKKNHGEDCDCQKCEKKRRKEDLGDEKTVSTEELAYDSQEEVSEEGNQEIAETEIKNLLTFDELQHTKTLNEEQLQEFLKGLFGGGAKPASSSSGQMPNHSGLAARLGQRRQMMNKALGKTDTKVLGFSKGGKVKKKSYKESLEIFEKKKELSIDDQMKISREYNRKSPEEKKAANKKAVAGIPKGKPKKDTRTDAQKMTDATGPRPGSRYRGD